MNDLSSTSSDSKSEHRAEDNETQQQQQQYYGPFHRVKSPTQSDDVALLQQTSQEIWGKARRGSDIPQVQTYTGPLPSNENGIEFTTTVKPDDGSPPGQARWTGPRDGVIIDNDDEFAKIKVTITKNTQITTTTTAAATSSLSAAAVTADNSSLVTPSSSTTSTMTSNAMAASLQQQQKQEEESYDLMAA